MRKSKYLDFEEIPETLKEKMVDEIYQVFNYECVIDRILNLEKGDD